MEGVTGGVISRLPEGLRGAPGE